ncbi:hypothetical protein [Kitasatospora sp. NPDC088548]|uniref:hypothetical protein n=1 Tax=Kitasatospora sp. NPDC088548 TaxID=3364075 RepID=UPI003826DFDD
MNEVIEAVASRRGRTWVVHLPEHAVYGHGRTLKAAQENTEQALAVAGVTATVKLRPSSPELELLRAAEAAYTAALSTAAAALALRRTTLRDIALATGVPTTRVKLLLAERSTAPSDVPDRAPDEPPEAAG